jgi:hypothetical protein
VATSSTDAATSQPEPTTEAPPETTVAAEEVDPASVPVLSAQQVCDLATAEQVSSAIGAEVTSVEPVDASTPQCSYRFIDAEGTDTNVSVAVQRPDEDLAGSAGQAGFDYATAIVLFDAPYETVDGVGDQAAITSSEQVTQMVVLAGGQVFTIATSGSAPTEDVTKMATLVAASLG